jgi:hypothetical protein
MDRARREQLSAEVKPIYFLDADHFSELFDEWRWWTEDRSGSYAPISIEKPHARGMEIGDYCYGLNTPLENSLHVRPNEKLIEFISDNMFPIDHDRIYFEIVARVDGVLVMAKYNKILGSRWLALLPSSSLDEIRDMAGKAKSS